MPDKIVKSKTTCEECGKEFDGEFIQHETAQDDWEWEKKKLGHEAIDEDGQSYWEEEKQKPATYLHLHEQPKPECHFCSDCIETFKRERLKK